MFSKVIGSIRSNGKMNKLVYFSLTALTVLAIASPGYAAGPGPGQSRATNGMVAASTLQGDTNAENQPEATCPGNGQCFADMIFGNTFYDYTNRLYMQDLLSGYPCGGPGEPCDQFNRPYYRPNNNVTRAQMSKFIDNARRLPEIVISTTTDTAPATIFSTANGSIALHALGTNVGVWGESYVVNGTGLYGGQMSASAGNSGFGVYGYGITAVGVQGDSNSNTGVAGLSESGVGVFGTSTNNSGVEGVSTGGVGVSGTSTSGYGVYGSSSSNYAGYFQGNVDVTGTCCMSAEGIYRIDDPTDPTNKYLNQSAVESSQMLGVYDGHVTLDANGEAWVDMPSWFQALNEDFNYQLTCVGGYAPVYVAQEIENSRFKIAGGKPGLKVSWQVTGVRHDPYAQQHPVVPEQAKPVDEQGTYLHPELYGQP